MTDRERTERTEETTAHDDVEMVVLDEDEDNAGLDNAIKNTSANDSDE